ncbi:hypothetical protein C0J52_04877 [Blattella germanica]|nr:hypothetical protein C0J52_04877 [Blattella germanica]
MSSQIQMRAVTDTCHIRDNRKNRFILPVYTYNSGGRSRDHHSQTNEWRVIFRAVSSRSADANSVGNTRH